MRPNHVQNMRNEIKIIANSWIWTSDFSSNYLPILRNVSRLGFDGVEIPVSTIYQNTDKIRQIIDHFRTKKKFEVVVTVGGTFDSDVSSNDAATRKNGLRIIEKCVRMSYELGGSLICGPMYAAVGRKVYVTKEERESILHHVAIEIRSAARYAKERGIRIALEPLCRYDTSLINTVSQGMRLVDMISSNNVGLLLDTFHMNIEEKSIASAILTAGERLFHFQASENTRGPPGSGLINWKEVWAALRSVNYNGLISIESFTPNDAELASRMHVRRKLARSQNTLAKEGMTFLRSLGRQLPFKSDRATRATL